MKYLYIIKKIHYYKSSYVLIYIKNLRSKLINLKINDFVSLVTTYVLTSL